MTGGRLVVVGTPIGNLADLSARGRDALADADLIACEDSRRAGRLLQQLGLAKKPLLVANEHSEARQAAAIVERIESGQMVALTSDAGMPAVSDPGQRVVQAVIDAGLPVDVVPGPTAVITALVASGLVADRFVFEGFLPRKGRERAKRMQELAGEQRVAVLYESPKRLAATLADLAAVCGLHRSVVVARELTKLHEEVVRGGLGQLASDFAGRSVRGEIVIVLGGAAPPPPADDAELARLLEAERQSGATTRDAVDAVVEQTGAPRRRVYELATNSGSRASGDRSDEG